MRIAIVSDTHGNFALAVRALDVLGHFDHIIHLGDTTADAEIMELSLGREMIITSGNCDMKREYPHCLVMDLCGKKFLITHGDRFQVKSGLAKIYQGALDEGADIVLYGHTHMPSIEQRDELTLMNPGAVTKAARNPTMGIITIEAGAVHGEIIDLNRLLDETFP